MSEEEKKIEPSAPLELVDKKKPKQYFGITTTYFTDPKTSEKHVIPTALSPKPTVDRIINYAERTNYVGILNIGMSGTGKSTWTTWLVHQLHIKKQFQIHWFYRDEIKLLDQHIKKLTKGINHVIVYDDASFVFDSLSKDELTNLAKHLTYIRHDVGGTVIIIMNIHYGTAVKKFFRNVPFKFLTSITMDEVFTLSDIYKYGKYKFLSFARYFQSMMFTGKWVFEINKWKGKVLPYTTDKPFRLGLALEGNYVHFFFYLKDGCGICDPGFTHQKLTDSEDLINTLAKKYTMPKAMRMLRMYSFFIHGLKVLPKRELSALRTIAKLDHSNQIEWDDVNKKIDSQTRPRSRSYVKSDDVDQVVNEVNEQSKAYKEQQTEFNKDIQETIDEEETKDIEEEKKEEPET